MSDNQQTIEELQTQADLLASINSALSTRAGLISSINSSIQGQTQSIVALNEVVLDTQSTVNNISSSFQNINQTFQNINSVGLNFLNNNFFNQLNTATQNTSNIALNVASGLNTSTQNIAQSNQQFAESQSELQATLSQVSGGVSENMQDVSESMAAQSDAVSTAGEQLVNAAEEHEELVEVTNTFGDRLKKIGKNLVRGVGQLGIAFANFTTSMIGTIADLAKSLATLPFTIARVAAAVGNELRQTLVEDIGQTVEDLKEKFDMSSYIGSGIVKISNMTKGMLAEFERPTSEMVKLFGFGKEGLKRFTASYGEMLESIGMFSEVFAGEISKNRTSYLYFVRLQKAAGYSAEDMKYLAMDAYNAVIPLKDRMEQAYSATRKVAEKYNLDPKNLSKNFMALRKDIVLFGTISDERLNETAAYMTRMGIDIKEAAAVFGKFSTFEDASNSMAILSQTFGMNISALDMLKAESPDEIFQMFHDAMLATGKSFDDLSRYEKSIMAQQTGMSAESLKIMMNYKRQGLNFEEARKKMEDDSPEKKQLRALSELQGAIKEIKKVLNFDSFTDALFKGLAQNMSLTGSTKKLLVSLSKGYEGLYEYASKIPDDTIMKIMTPIKEIIKTMNKIFSDPNFIKSLEHVLSGVGDLLTMALAASEEGPINVTVDNVTARLNAAISTGNNAFSKLGDMTKKIAGALLRGAMIGLTAVIKTLTSLMAESDPSKKTPGFMQLLTNIPAEEFEMLYEEMMSALEGLFSESGRLGGIGLSLMGQITSLFTELAFIFADLLWIAVSSVFGSFKYEKASFSQAKAYQQSSGDISPEAMLKSTDKKYKDRVSGSIFKFSDLDKDAQESVVLSISIIDDLYKQGFPDMGSPSKEFINSAKANLNSLEMDTVTLNNLHKRTHDYLEKPMQPFSEYRKNSSLPLVRQLQEQYDAENQKKSNANTQSTNDASINFPAADSQLKLFGKDNEPINLNDMQSFANTSGGGIFADIMRMTSSITEDAVEVRTLSSQKFEENKFKKNDKKSEMIAKIKSACSVIDEKIKSIKEDETVNSSLNLDIEQLTNLARNLLDIRVGFNKMSGMPQYNQGTFVQDVAGMGNTSNNSGDFDAPRPSYFKRR